MKRKTFVAELASMGSDGELISSGVAYARNSAIRASEGLVRTYARETGEGFEGLTPSTVGGIYFRDWYGLKSGIGLSVVVKEMVPA